jgi:tyrosine-specific transport protein
MVISFGFHNLIPTITKYMNGDLRKVKISIILGSLFALIIYIIWDLIVLGTVPRNGEYGLINNLKLGRDASQAIAGILGNCWVSHFATGLAFFSYLTSLLIQSLALTHFLNDGLKNKFSMPFLIVITLFPPLVCSILEPTIFFKALDFAGGICAVILFGIFPVLMVWNGRYRKKLKYFRYQVKGGKPLLVSVFFFAIFIILFQITMMLLPKDF